MQNDMQAREETLRAQDLNQQGSMLLKTGNIEAAREKFEEAIEIEPMLMDSYKNYGELYLLTGDYQEAKNYYKKALLIEKAGDVYFQYGNACFLNDEPHEGLDYYNRALSAGYDSDEMFFFMGLAYEHMNDDTMALRYIQKAINKNPSRPDYKVKKISILLRLNETGEAKEAVEDLLRNDPELYDGYHMKTILLLQEGNFEEAVEFSKKASERFPEDADLLFDYAQALARSGRYDDTVVLIERAKRLKYYENAKTRFTFLESQIYAEKNDFDQAIEKCLECIAPENEVLPEFEGQVRFMLVNLYITKTDFENALSQAEAILERDMRDSYYFAALYYKPFCLAKLGREEESKHYYQEAISLYRLATLENPEAFEAYLYRAMCLKDMEQYDEALELLDFMEQLSDGQIAEVYTIRADLYKLMEKPTLQKEALEKAYKLKPELRELFQEEE